MALTAEQRKSYGDAYIQQAFTDLLGRNPTAIEIDRFFPSMGTDPNIHDIASMRSRVAEFAQQEKEKSQPEDDKKKMQDTAKGYEEGIGSLIKTTLGRDATPEEKNHFALLKAQGFDDYQLGQALQQLPEYMEKQDSTAREQLRGELSTADQDFFTKNVMPGIQSQFALQGRDVNSSSFASALANAAKDIETERGTYLAGLGREDYVNRRSQTINQYVSDLGRQYQTQDYATQRADQLSDVYRQRQYGLTDYDMEKNAYAEYLRNYGKKKKGGLFNGSTGTLIGMGVGAALAAPTGGMSIPMGASLGGALGSAGGQMYEGYM